MAYRKTELVLAGIEARKAKIIAAAISIISKHGMDGLTCDTVAERAKVSVGLIYKYFPDMTEVRAAVVAHLLASDLKTLREAVIFQIGIRTWAKHLAENYRLMSVVGTAPVYREGIKAELQRQLRLAGAESPAMSSAVVYGAVLEAAGTLKPRDETALVEALRRACGLRARVAA